MSRRQLTNGFVSIAVLLIASYLASGQNKQPQTPDNKDRKVKREDNRALRDWPKKDVKLIITPEEESAYSKLKTDEERENFIFDFWRRRDPTPDTEENEYKDEYYERLAYANEHFSSGKEGWLTDRGRIYIKWGKPDEVDSHPSGGQYQRQSYEGEGTTTTYPFERWFYRSLPGIGSGIEIEFVDPTGSGEFRLANDPSEKEIAGLGNRARTGEGSLESRNYERHQSPFALIELRKDLEGPPPVRGNSLSGASRGTPVLDDNALNFEIKPYYFQQSDGRVVAAFTVQTPNRELVFQPSGGLQMARLNILAKVLTVTQQRVGSFEETVTTTATAAELADAKERLSVYGKAVILTPGRYRLDVLLRDVSSGALGFKQFAFTVPKFDASKLEISSIVLAAKLESLKDRIPDNQFSIGLTKVVPNISGEYHRGSPVGVYLQVYNAGIDQTTLRPAADVEYVIVKDGKELGKRTEDWTGMSDAGQRLTLARLIDTSGLAPGSYEVQIHIHDHVTGQILSPSAKFTVLP